MYDVENLFTASAKTTSPAPYISLAILLIFSSILSSRLYNNLKLLGFSVAAITASASAMAPGPPSAQ